MRNPLPRSALVIASSIDDPTKMGSTMGPFIRVRSPRFGVLPGEAEELVNEGMYGKALAEYLTDRLRDRGYDAPFFCAEDWGWWVELAGFPFSFGVCIYGRQLADGQLDLYVTDGATAARRWSWRQFRYISTTEAVAKLHADLIAVFEADPEVRVLAVDLEFPFVADEP